ncbi:MAG: hypothetical protein ACKV22_10255 [Bryobacteraceae bacterium]
MMCRSTGRLVAATAILALLAATAEAKKKKKGKDGEEEEITQTLEVIPDPPAAISVDTRRLSFYVTPLSAKGLLSQQTREAVKNLLRQVHGAHVVRIRGFVAGSGDLRRVQSIVAEMFAERRLPLPVLSVIQVGALAAVGAQVVLEATALEKKEVNPNGLAWISGQGQTDKNPLANVMPMAQASVENLKKAVDAIGVERSGVLRVTCFLSGLDTASGVPGLVASTFPGTVFLHVQVQRASYVGVAECEAVARLSKPGSSPVEMINPEALPKSPNFTQIAAVSAPKVILSGAQMQFGYQDSDARLAFQRLTKVLDAAGTSVKHVVFASTYPLSPSLSEQVRRLRFDYFDPSRPPASTLLPFEGLPAMEAGFAIDVVAIPK